MAYVVTLQGFRPPPREDDVPYNRARIEESGSPGGPWVSLGLQALVPLDADPAAPQTRNLTAANATLQIGWYRVVFLDALDNESQPSAAVHNVPEGTVPPTVADIRARSAMIRGRYPADPYDADREADLQLAIDDAVGLVAALTCRTLDETLGIEWVLLALRAITLKTEQLALSGEAKRRRKAITNGNLRSISAGPWSEAYFGPEEASKAKRLDPDPLLHEALWALATEECREAWLALWNEEPAPAGMVQSFHHRGLPGRY